ncbi:cupredoxin domain-containing protein [Methanosarcina barkeri]|uniref:Cell surface lipoprotein n=2 Tax=Methanosarcina barkeri TaxID=2208 RepID=A0A0E3QYQ1_METBA|nr:cell surface lipoprotein [Methanosarcina barkeri]AKB57059.1 Cell surface lipoprotein [Methanosarcina barkeri 227]
MKTKQIILLLMALSVIISGCLSSENEKDNGKKDREASGSSGGSQRQREVRTPVGMQEETWTPEKTETEGEMWTPEETGTQEEMGTQKEMVTQVDLDTPEEAEISGMTNEPEMEQTETWTGEKGQAGANQPGETVPKSHLVRLKNYLMIPSSLKINLGDTVVWRNYQESSVLTMTSKKHLFEDQRLAYGNTLEYTFNESGSYNFSVKGYPKMQTTITVK